MVLWGGLRPIASRVILDGGTLVAWIYGASTGVVVDHVKIAAGTPRPLQSYVFVLVSCGIAVLTAGSFTNRWTLTFPMVPYLVLQGLRRLVPRRGRWQRYLHVVITCLSFLCIILAAALCILFPAVELPPIEGPFNVGKVDLFLPMHTSELVHGDESTTSTNNHHHNPHSQAVWVRLLYPTLDPPKSLPYLTPATAAEYCYHSMQFGAPPPLRQFDWMLHTWRLTERLEREGASLIPTKDPLPTIIYSHGLGGHADIYSFQTHSLAAHGNVVLTISHADGTSPAITQPDGTKREYDYEPQRLEKEPGNYMKTLQMRRNQNEWRVQELLAATQALHRWNQSDIHEDLPFTAALSLKGRLDLKNLTWAGHSFGGATVLTAAHRHPELVATVIAHEPAIDWAHPSSIASLFAKQRVADLALANMYNTTLFGDHSDDDSLHQGADILLLFSHEWVRNQWAMIPLIREMQKKQRLGSDKTLVAFDYVPEMHHNEFSDTAMLTPLWLARSVGLTGKRNPIDTARDVAQRTLDFLNQSRRKASLTLS